MRIIKLRKNFKGYFIIIFAICLFVPSVVYAVWWNPLSWFNNWGKGEAIIEQKVLPDVIAPEKKDIYKDTIKDDDADNGETVADNNVVAYGVEMDSKCFLKFQKFIDNDSSDYSKCLADLNFYDEYCGGFDPDTQGLSDINFIVILDSSGSMSEKIGGERKIDIAKKAVSDLLIKMPKGVKTGLIVYGHKGSNSTDDKNISCNEVEEVVKLDANKSDDIINAMNLFSPRGWTPIAGSIDFAKEIFKNAGVGNKNYLILFSDGIESCDGNPTIAAQNLNTEIKGVKLNVIGFTSDNNIQTSLQKVANLGGGTYSTASNSSDIAKVFNDELLAVKKECLYITLSKMSYKNSANNMSNLECWLSSYKMESDNFLSNIWIDYSDLECNKKISNALKNRRDEFWFMKEAIIEKNNIIYKEIEVDFNKQLKLLETSKR